MAPVATVMTCAGLVSATTQGGGGGARPGRLGRGRQQGRSCYNVPSSRLSSPPSPWLTSTSRAIASSKRSFRAPIRASDAAGGAGVTSNNGAAVVPSEPTLTRKNFPSGFVFGAATSSYQIEGAWNEGGKGDSIWDYYCRTYPDSAQGQWRSRAVNSYNMYEEDVKMLKAMGMDSYRFSISWPRILPDGTLAGGINQEGIDHYNKFINKLIEYGIKPFVTLFHWETSQALDKEYNSFLSRKIVDDFADYAEVCFKSFGDRVKHWFTFNEPYTFCSNAYGSGKHAPGRCSPGMTCAVPEGNSLVEPYVVGHHLILAHAKAARIYKQKYQEHQEGKIGMALVSMGYQPYNDRQFVDSQGQERSIDFNLGWFLEPLFRGDYPFSMRALVRDRLPYFTAEEKTEITGTYDMMGLNYYTSRYSESVDLAPNVVLTTNADDSYAEPLTSNVSGQPIGTPTGADWLYSCPEGLKELLMYIKDKYRNPPLYITENGIGDMDEYGRLPMEEALNDTTRLEYIQNHLAKLRESIALGSNVRGHFTWSLLDNFEWQNGYTERFGLVYVDRDNGYKRTMKKSAHWFAHFNGVLGSKDPTATPAAMPPVNPTPAAVPAAAAAAINTAPAAAAVPPAMPTNGAVLVNAM